MRRRWLRIRPNGATETALQNRVPEGEGWALVPIEITGIVGSHPDRFAPTSDGKSVRQRLKVRLSLSTDRFRADGSDEAVFMVIPESEEAKALTEIEVDVNGEIVRVAPFEAVPIRTTETGAFKVRLADPRVFTMGSQERFTRALEPSRYEEELERVRDRQSVFAAARAYRLSRGVDDGEGGVPDAGGVRAAGGGAGTDAGGGGGGAP